MHRIATSLLWPGQSNDERRIAEQGDQLMKSLNIDVLDLGDWTGMSDDYFYYRMRTLLRLNLPDNLPLENRVLAMCEDNVHFRNEFFTHWVPYFMHFLISRMNFLKNITHGWKPYICFITDSTVGEAKRGEFLHGFVEHAFVHGTFVGGTGYTKRQDGLVVKEWRNWQRSNTREKYLENNKFDFISRLTCNYMPYSKADALVVLGGFNDIRGNSTDILKSLHTFWTIANTMSSDYLYHWGHLPQRQCTYNFHSRDGSRGQNTLQRYVLRQSRRSRMKRKSRRIKKSQRRKR